MTGQINVNKIAARSGNTITVNSGDVLQAPGHVLQVVSGTAATETSFTASSFFATSTTVSITPTSTSSKILVSAVVPVQCATSGLITYTLYRNSTNLGNSTYGMGRFYMAASRDANATMIILDSPSTTSATTYAVYMLASGGGTHYYNIANEPSHIIAQEIAQ